MRARTDLIVAVVAIAGIVGGVATMALAGEDDIVYLGDGVIVESSEMIGDTLGTPAYIMFEDEYDGDRITIGDGNAPDRRCPYFATWDDDADACVVDFQITTDQPMTERLIVRLQASCFVPTQPIPVERTDAFTLDSGSYEIVFAQEFEIPHCP